MRELALAGVVLAAAPIALLLLAPPWVGARAARRTLAWRNRLATAGFVLSFALVSRCLFPDAHERAQFAYICVLTLGYGHLIGAAVFSWRRLAQRAPTGVTPALWGSFWAVSSFTLLALYVWGSGLFVPLTLPLLAISAWHTVENDLVLERAYGDRLRLGPIPRALEHHLASIGLTALMLAVGEATLSAAGRDAFLAGTAFAGLGNGPLRLLAAAAGGALLARRRWRPLGLLGAGMIAAAAWMPVDLTQMRWLCFGDFFAAVTLYHLISWLVFLADRARGVAPGEAGVRGSAAWRRIAWLHVPPALVCAVLLAWPVEPLLALRNAVFSPPIYLFWSALHVVQTALARGWEPAAR